MAIYYGGVAGLISGKLGGVVFSRVSGRQVVRSYTKPVQPNTIAQMNARANFGASAQSYHSLTDYSKANWESYAKSRFNAKDQFNEGQWSGANAFVSNRNIAQNCLSNPLALDYSDDSGTPLDGTAVPFAFSSKPPVDQLAANIKSSDVESPAGMEIDMVEFHANGTFNIAINFTGLTTGTLGQPSLVDGHDNPFGFCIYISEVINQQHNRVVNPCRQLIGAMPSITGGTADLTSAKGIQILNANPINYAKYKSFPQAGDDFQVKIYAVSTTGMIACIGNKLVNMLAV